MFLALASDSVADITVATMSATLYSSDRQRELAGLDLGEIEHVVDQAEQVLAVALHALQHALRLVRQIAVEAVGHHLGVAEDGVERRAQLVAHVGEELRLVLARHLELATLFLYLGEQAHVLDGDNRLGGEGFEQFDLARRERSGCGLAQQHAANRIALSKHGGRQQRTDAGPSGKLDGQGVLHRVE